MFDIFVTGHHHQKYLIFIQRLVTKVCKVLIFRYCLGEGWPSGYGIVVNNNNNNNKHDNVYGAVIMAEPLREFTRFI